MTDQNNHRITGIDIPFWDLVLLWIKLSLAALPAAVFLAVVGALVAFFIAAASAVA